MSEGADLQARHDVLRLREHRDYIAGLLDEANAEIARHHADFQKWEDMADRAVRRAERAEAEAERLREALRRGWNLSQYEWAESHPDEVALQDGQP